MKISKYNYIVEEDSTSYWFNGISNRFFSLNKTLSDKVKTQIDDITYIQENIPTFYNNLKDNGFIIEDDVNELDTIRQINKGRREVKNYFAIVLPTLDCNFSCWYCVQEHKKGTMMNEQTLENLKKHFEYMIFEEKVENIHLEWFGGEPFMYFDEVVRPLTQYVMDLCEDSDIGFMASATTNGYYLNNEVALLLEDLKFNNFQITIDGIRDLHNKTKNSKDGNSAFDTTLNNINNILNISDKIRLTLRLNYTDENLKAEIVDQVNEIIEEKNRSKVNILLRKVWQEEVDNKRCSSIFEVKKKYKESGYNTSNWDLDTGFVTCYADKLHYNAINYDGSVFKCTATDENMENPPGKLREDGSIEWEEGFIEKYYKLRFENELCLSCKDLPLCMGKCARDYETEGDEPISECTNVNDMSIEDRILAYCKELSE